MGLYSVRKVRVFALVLLLDVGLVWLGGGAQSTPAGGLSSHSVTMMAKPSPTVLRLQDTATPVLPTETAMSAVTPMPTATPSPPPTPTTVYAGVPDVAASVEPVEMARLQRPPAATPVRPLLFEKRLLVGLYGTPGGPGLGILGTTSATKTVALAREQELAYQELLTDTIVIPYFHMVTTIADPHPGADKDYNHRALTTTIQSWIDVAQRHAVWSVLDIQPAHSPLTVELAYVAPFLRQRDVHLAIDPEFMMSETARIPGARIGFMDGDDLNLVQAWLNDVAIAIGQRKMLIIHQFDNRMFAGKEAIVDYPMVDLVWDADGFGSPHPKVVDYVQYAGEPGFEYGGFKLFYNYDVPVMTPAQVLGLEPQPVLVMYQ